MKPLPGRVTGQPAGRQMTERRAGLIKRIRLATAKRGLGREEFAGGWREAVAAAAAAPERVRPSRLTVSVSLPEIAADQRHDGVALEWFGDREHLRRFESWLGTAPGRAVQRLRSEVIEFDASPVVVTSERVTRGADWLERRWQEGGPKLKQLAIATRADGLTLPQFLARWGGRGGLAPIPDAYRGLAYVENHPLVTDGRDWAYDAINEVYFDDADSLLARTAYFERELTGGAGGDLVRASWFLAVSEDPIRLPR
jgi:hypothetical protein